MAKTEKPQGARTVHYVKAVWDSQIFGFEHLESEDEYGFYRSDADHRPGWATWVKKHPYHKCGKIACVPCHDLYTDHKEIWRAISDHRQPKLSIKRQQ
jgi:hypothetical protein